MSMKQIRVAMKYLPPYPTTVSLVVDNSTGCPSLVGTDIPCSNSAGREPESWSARLHKRWGVLVVPVAESGRDFDITGGMYDMAHMKHVPCPDPTRGGYSRALVRFERLC